MRVPLRQIHTMSGDAAMNVLNKFMRETSKALNSVEFGDGLSAENMGGVFLTVPVSADAMTGTAGFGCQHKLGKAPSGYLIVSKTQSGSMYTSGSPIGDETNIYLKWEGAIEDGASATLFVF